MVMRRTCPSLTLLALVAVCSALTVYFTEYERQNALAREVDKALPKSHGSRLSGEEITMGEGTGKPIYPADLLENIRALRDSGFDVSELVDQHMLSAEALDSALIKSTMAANAAIILIPEEGKKDAGDRLVLGNFGGDEWLAVFRDVLHCPLSSETPYSPSDDPKEWANKFESRFRQAIRDYPLLGRYSSIYGDITYTYREVSDLRRECLEVKSLATSNKAALAGLNKLINVCDEALVHHMGILLTFD